MNQAYGEKKIESHSGPKCKQMGKFSMIIIYMLNMFGDVLAICASSLVTILFFCREAIRFNFIYELVCLFLRYSV